MLALQVGGSREWPYKEAWCIVDIKHWKVLEVCVETNKWDEPLERYTKGNSSFKTTGKQNGLWWTLGKRNTWFSSAISFLQGSVVLICLTFLTSSICMCFMCSSQLTVIAADGPLCVFKSWRLFRRDPEAFPHGTLLIPLHFWGSTGGTEDYLDLCKSVNHSYSYWYHQSGANNQRRWLPHLVSSWNIPSCIFSSQLLLLCMGGMKNK